MLSDDQNKETGYRLYFIYKDKERKIDVKQSYFSEAEEGRIIQLPIRKGALGARFIAIKEMNNN
ncbi:MAG: hypothetical protein AAFO07_13795 [Bacteroidota bacterium]